MKFLPAIDCSSSCNTVAELLDSDDSFDERLKFLECECDSFDERL